MHRNGQNNDNRLYAYLSTNGYTTPRNASSQSTNRNGHYYFYDPRIRHHQTNQQNLYEYQYSARPSHRVPPLTFNTPRNQYDFSSASFLLEDMSSIPTDSIADLGEPISIFDEIHTFEHRRPTFPTSLPPSTYVPPNPSRRPSASEVRLATANVLRDQLLNDIERTMDEIDRDLTSLERRPSGPRYMPPRFSPIAENDNQEFKAYRQNTVHTKPPSVSSRATLRHIVQTPITHSLAQNSAHSSVADRNSGSSQNWPSKPKRVYEVIPRLTSESVRGSRQSSFTAQPDEIKMIDVPTKDIPTKEAEKPNTLVSRGQYHYAPEAEEKEILENDPENVNRTSKLETILTRRTHETLDANDLHQTTDDDVFTQEPIVQALPIVNTRKKSSKPYEERIFSPKDHVQPDENEIPALVTPMIESKSRADSGLHLRVPSRLTRTPTPMYHKTEDYLIDDNEPIVVPVPVETDRRSMKTSMDDENLDQLPLLEQKIELPTEMTVSRPTSHRNDEPSAVLVPSMRKFTDDDHLDQLPFLEQKIELPTEMTVSRPTSRRNDEPSAVPVPSMETFTDDDHLDQLPSPRLSRFKPLPEPESAPENTFEKPRKMISPHPTTTSKGAYFFSDFDNEPDEDSLSITQSNFKVPFGTEIRVDDERSKEEKEFFFEQEEDAITQKQNPTTTSIPTFSSPLPKKVFPFSSSPHSMDDREVQPTSTNNNNNDDYNEQESNHSPSRSRNSHRTIDNEYERNPSSRSKDLVLNETQRKLTGSSIGRPISSHRMQTNERYTPIDRTVYRTLSPITRKSPDQTEFDNEQENLRSPMPPIRQFRNDNEPHSFSVDREHFLRDRSETPFDINTQSDDQKTPSPVPRYSPEFDNEPAPTSRTVTAKKQQSATEFQHPPDPDVLFTTTDEPDPDNPLIMNSTIHIRLGRMSFEPDNNENVVDQIDHEMIRSIDSPRSLSPLSQPVRIEELMRSNPSPLEQISYFPSVTSPKQRNHSNASDDSLEYKNLVDKTDDDQGFFSDIRYSPPATTEINEIKAISRPKSSREPTFITEEQEPSYATNSQQKSKLSLQMNKIEQNNSPIQQEDLPAEQPMKSRRRRRASMTHDAAHFQMEERQLLTNWRDRVADILAKKHDPNDKYAYVPSKVNSFANFEYQPRKIKATPNRQIRSMPNRSEEQQFVKRKRFKSKKSKIKSETSADETTDDDHLDRNQSAKDTAPQLFGRLWCLPDGSPTVFHELLDWHVQSRLKAYSYENFDYTRRRHHKRKRKWHSETKLLDIEKDSSNPLRKRHFTQSTPRFIIEDIETENNRFNSDDQKERKIFDIKKNRKQQNDNELPMNLFDNDSLPNDESPQGKKSNGQTSIKSVRWNSEAKVRTRSPSADYVSRTSSGHIRIFDEKLNWDAQAKVHCWSEIDLRQVTRKKAIFAQHQDPKWSDTATARIDSRNYQYWKQVHRSETADRRLLQTIDQDSEYSTSDHRNSSMYLPEFRRVNTPPNRPRWNAVSKKASVNSVYNPKINDSNTIRRSWDREFRRKRVHKLPPLKRKRDHEDHPSIGIEPPPSTLTTTNQLALEYNYDRGSTTQQGRTTSNGYMTMSSRRSSRALVPLNHFRYTSDTELPPETPRSQRPVQQEWYEEMSKSRMTQRTDGDRAPTTRSFRMSIDSLHRPHTPKELVTFRSSTRNSQNSVISGTLIDSTIRTNRATELRLLKDMDEHHQHSHTPSQSMPIEVRGFTLEGTPLTVADHATIRPLSNVNYQASERVKSRRVYPWSNLHPLGTTSRNSSLVPIAELRRPSLDTTITEAQQLIAEE